MASTVGSRDGLDRIVLAGVLIVAGGAIALSPVEASLPAYLGGAAGLIAVHERLRPEFSRAIAILTTLLIFAGTSLLWSMTTSTAFADAAAFGTVAALWLLASRLRLPAAAVVWALIALTPWFFQRLTGESGGSAALFSSTDGFLSLTPVAYVAVIGSVFYLRRDPLAATASFLIFSIWIAGASRLLPGGGMGAFPHGLTSALALFAPGLAVVIDLARRRPLVAVVPLILVALANNFWLMVQYTTGMIPKDAPVSFAAMTRQQADVHTRTPYFYPFAFPANVWFALRERVPIERYELLAFEPRSSAFDLTLDRTADRFLLDGWDAPGPDEVGPVRWLGMRRADLALPLAPDGTRGLEITVTARARLDDPPVDVDLGLEMNGHEIGRFVIPAASPIDVHARIPVSAVGRLTRAGYNRLTFVSYGVQRAETVEERPNDSPPKPSGSRVWPVAIYRIRISPTS